MEVVGPAGFQDLIGRPQTWALSSWSVLGPHNPGDAMAFAGIHWLGVLVIRSAIIGAMGV